MTTRRRVLIALGVVGVVIVLILITLRPWRVQQTPQEQKATTLAPVTIGYSRLRISLPLFVAQERQLFQKHGISATLLMYETAQPLMQSLAEGKIDLGGYTALPITYSAMLRSQQSLYFATAMLEDQAHRISYLLRRTGSPIKALSDLRGKRIGILPTIAYKAWLQELLRANHVNLASVVIQNVAPELEVSTLKSGGIDALFSNDPVATAALAAGAGELITNTVEVPMYLGTPFLFGSFNARRTWADQHSVEFNNVVAALDEAIDFLMQQPVAAKEYIKKYIPAQFRDQVSLYPDALYLQSNATTKEMFQKEADAEFKLGILPSAVELDSLIYRATK